MQSIGRKTFNITMETDKLGLKQTVLISIYADIDSRARKIAGDVRDGELLIVRDGKDGSRFHIAVSPAMAPNLLSAVQEILNKTDGIELRSHFQRLQEMVMAELFAGAKDIIQVG